MKVDRICIALAGGADILVQNFRVGVMDRLGLGYAQLREVNPRLIYCSISGFGEEGPLRQAGCSDPIMQAYSGFARLNGAPGESLDAFRFTGFVDLSTAAVAVESILAALLDRERNGHGQEVRVSMIEAALEMQCTRVAEWLGAGELATPRGSAAAAFAPDRAYQSADYEVFVSVCRDSEWAGFCRALARPDLLEDARFTTNVLRVQHRAELDALVEPVVANEACGVVAPRLRQTRRRLRACAPFRTVPASPAGRGERDARSDRDTVGRRDRGRNAVALQRNAVRSHVAAGPGRAHA